MCPSNSASVPLDYEGKASHSLGPRKQDRDVNAPSLTPRTHDISQEEDIFLGGSSCRLFLKHGGSEFCTSAFVAKCWTKSCAADIELYVYNHAKLLRPLQGTIVSHIHGTSKAGEGGISCAMSTPHSVGWRHATKVTPKHIQDKIIAAYERIHERRILHGNVAFRHILIGDSEEVTIIDFSKVRTLDDHTAAGIKRCQEADLQLEMRRLKYMFDYDGAKEHERRLANAVANPTSSDAEVDRFDLSELDAIDEEPVPDDSRFEVAQSRRSDPSEQDAIIQRPTSPTGHSSQVPLEGTDTQSDDRTEHLSSSDTETSSLSPEDHDTFPVIIREIRAPRPVRPPSGTAYLNIEGTRSSSRQNSSSPVRRSPISSPARLLGELGVAGTDHAQGPPSPVPYTSKRVFDVAFHPDTEDNGLWANGRSLKRRRKRPPTPFIATTQAPKADDSDSDTQPQARSQHLSASWEENINPRELPPQRATSRSPSALDGEKLQPKSTEEDEVVIVITSPTGQRRVWGVPEDVATQISRLLDKHSNTTQSEHEQQQESRSPSLGVKRKADQFPAENGHRPKLSKITHSFFSRFFR
ncbi:hypothetical protein NM688_g5189 [Phlebia brevispora]|uniref:Uncharacterized protein n=1 Tax=Phlebia brevispora TaxID=194682 RepID=A0ACC1SZF7_9APHY|nr:hypothetical protein NM688_g5189 [Phlebia brevispora]